MSTISLDDSRFAGPVRAAIWSAFLLRTGSSAASVIIGFYLTHLNRHGTPISAVAAAILLSSSYAAELFVAPLMGALSDRYGRKPFIMAGPLLGLIAIQVYPFASSLPPLFAARLLEGVAAATLTPATLGFLADATAGAVRRRGRTMAFYEIATLVGMASGYVIGGPMWQHLHIDAFRTAAVLYLVSALVVWIWLSNALQVRHRGKARLAGYVAVMRQPRLLRFAPAWLAVTAVLGAWFNNVVYQLSGPNRHGQLLVGGMSGNQVGAILGGFTLALILGTYIWSHLFDRFDRKTSIMLIALLGLVVVCIDLVLLNHRGGASHAWLYLLLAVLGLAIATESGFTPAALAYLADMTEDFPADRGVIMGLYSIFLSIGEVAGGVVGGPFAQAWGIDGIIGLTLLLTGVAIVTVWRLRKHEQPGRIEESPLRVSEQAALV